MFNAGTVAVDFGLPPLPPGYRWHLAVDTSRPAPQDLPAAGEETLLDNSTTFYHVEARSSTILLARISYPPINELQR
jgi:glycogen operon protein